MYHFRKIVLYSLPLFLQTTLAAYFSQCSPKVLNLNISDNKKQYFLSLDPSRPLLTLFGCEQLCGKGYELWPVQDTLGRFVLWVLPAIILIAHYHFAPLSSR